MRLMLCGLCSQRRPIYIRRYRFRDRMKTIVAADSQHSLCSRCANSTYQRAIQSQMRLERVTPIRNLLP